MSVTVCNCPICRLTNERFARPVLGERPGVDLCDWIDKLLFDESIEVRVDNCMVIITAHKNEYAITRKISRDAIVRSAKCDSLIESEINQAIRNVRVASGHLTTGTP